MLNAKCGLADIMRSCIQTLKTRSAEELTAAANKFFADEAAKFKDIASIITQQDQNALFDAISQVFDGVSAQVDGIVAKIEKQREDVLKKQDEELEKMLEGDVIVQKVWTLED